MELITIGFVLLGLGLGIKLYMTKRMKEEALFKKIMDESPMPVLQPLEETTTCSAKKEAHQWEPLDIKILGEKGYSEVESKLVCMKCGMIFGLDRQFSQAGLEKVRKQQKAMDEAEAFVKEMDIFKKTELDRMAAMLKDEKEREIFRLGFDACIQINDSIVLKIEERRKQ